MILEQYYNINFLKINADKSKLMIICKPKYRETVSKIKLQANQYVIEQTNKIKILGIFITNNMDNTPNINHIIQKVNYRINILHKITKYTNLKTKLILYNSLVISVFNYCIENLISAKVHHHRKLNVLLNKCGHKILGIQSYKLTTTNMHKKLGWMSVQNMITYSALKLMHRITFEAQPPALVQYLQYNMVKSDIARLVRKPSINHMSLSSKTSHSFLHRTCYIYNELPDNYRTMNKKQFKSNIKNYIIDHFPPNRIPKINSEIYDI